jgi:hypothetical protein
VAKIEHRFTWTIRGETVVMAENTEQAREEFAKISHHKKRLVRKKNSTTNLEIVDVKPKT